MAAIFRQPGDQQPGRSRRVESRELGLSFRADIASSFAHATGIETTDFARVSPNLDGTVVNNLFGLLYSRGVIRQFVDCWWLRDDVAFFFENIKSIQRHSASSAHRMQTATKTIVQASLGRVEGKISATGPEPFRDLGV
jgi:hypothetical protein